MGAVLRKLMLGHSAQEQVQDMMAEAAAISTPDLGPTLPSPDQFHSPPTPKSSHCWPVLWNADRPLVGTEVQCFGTGPVLALPPPTVPRMCFTTCS